MTQPEAQSRISPEWAKDWVERFLAADTSHDLEQLLSFVADDVTYSNSRSGVVGGKAAVATIQEALYRAFPDIAFEAVGEPLISTDGTRLAFEWKGTGTFTGRLEPQGVEPTGVRFELTGISVAEFKDGLVHRLKSAFDSPLLTRQPGGAPAPPASGPASE